MTLQVKIYGAGSIGNHLAFACRSQGWNVTICDTDVEALKRTREQIYPARYGEWDAGIELTVPENVYEQHFDLVIVGTPPDSHVELALSELENSAGKPSVVLVEKPLCGPSLDRCDELWDKARDSGVTVCVGYNHVVTHNSVQAEEVIRTDRLGQISTITVEWVEHWGGIFAAHPWLDGPADSYLGQAASGGGACGEHSHGINIWQHFAHKAGAGRIVEVSAVMDRVSGAGVDYDRIAQISVVTETGLTGFIVQDVVTHPPRKRLRVQGERGAMVWEANRDSGHDAVALWNGENWEEQRIAKTRRDDFLGEIQHVGGLCRGEVAESPISLERGLETMMVIAAANRSAREKRCVEIDYSAGFNASAIR